MSAERATSLPPRAMPTRKARIRLFWDGTAVQTVTEFDPRASALLTDPCRQWLEPERVVEVPA